MRYNKHASALNGFVEWDDGDHGSGTQLDLSQIDRDREAEQAKREAREASLATWEEFFPGEVKIEDGRAWILGDDGKPLELIPSNWTPKNTTQDDLIDLVIGGCE
jgi:hypothetical protein